MGRGAMDDRSAMDGTIATCTKPLKVNHHNGQSVQFATYIHWYLNLPHSNTRQIGRSKYGRVSNCRRQVQILAVPHGPAVRGGAGRWTGAGPRKGWSHGSGLRGVGDSDLGVIL